MRAYFFGNMYLSSIQQGIQAAHCISDIFAAHNYNFVTESKTHLMNWANDHKTMILLNAGFSEEIADLGKFFENSENPYPSGVFHEAEESLDGAITCAGIVLPEKIYETARLIRNEKPTPNVDSISNVLWNEGEIMHNLADGTLVKWKFNKWEAQLCDRLNQYGMAK